jgi:hypothetical protein
MACRKVSSDSYKWMGKILHLHVREIVLHQAEQLAAADQAGAADTEIEIMKYPSPVQAETPLLELIHTPSEVTAADYGADRATCHNGWLYAVPLEGPKGTDMGKAARHATAQSESNAGLGEIDRWRSGRGRV